MVNCEVSNVPDMPQKLNIYSLPMTHCYLGKLIEIHVIFCGKYYRFMNKPRDKFNLNKSSITFSTNLSQKMKDQVFYSLNMH